MITWVITVAAPVACLAIVILPDGNYCDPGTEANTAAAYMDMINNNRFSFDIFLAFYVALGRTWLLYELVAVGTTQLHWLLPSCIATVVADLGIVAFRLGGEIICHTDARTGLPPVAMGVACASTSDLSIVQITILLGTLMMLLITAVRATKCDASGAR